MFVHAALAAILTAFLLPSAPSGQSTAVVIRDDRAEFCLTLDGAGEWFWAIYDGPSYSSSAMSTRRVMFGKGKFADSRGVRRGETDVQAKVSGAFVHGRAGRPGPDGSVGYPGTWRLTLRDRDSGRKYRIQSGELLVIPVGCFDPGRF